MSGTTRRRLVGSLRILKIKLVFGSASGRPPLEVQTGRVVLIVGPNNSGKSLSLREIESWCLAQAGPRKIIDSLDVDFPDSTERGIELIREFEAEPPQNQPTPPGQFWVTEHAVSDQPTRQTWVDPNSFASQILQRNPNFMRSWFTTWYTIRLDGRTRFSLAEPKPTGDLQLHPQNHLWALFVDDESRERVRRLTEEAFGLSLVIDPTAMNVFRIRMSQRAPSSTSEEKGLDESARRFHRTAPLITEFSDGVQAFVGLVSAVLSLPHKIILIDEPEAFLHPPLAHRLGFNMAKIATERDASLVVATHSPQFLIGCVEAERDVSIIRLTFQNGNATARALQPGEIVNIVADPLLRSTNVLAALFHRAVIATESDTDRAFYEVINERLTSVGRGVADSLFLNAQNKQTIHRLIAPLRRIGIPAAALIDLDFLEDGGSVWQRTLEACNVPTARISSLDARRVEVFSLLSGRSSSDGQPVVKRGGVNLLTGTEKDRATQFLGELAMYGLFLVPGGELESWLPSLDIRGHGPDWLLGCFSRIGQTEADSNYLRPAADDVWMFLDAIAGWVNNQNRLGID